MRRRPALSRLLSAMAGLACGLLGAELTFGSLRPEAPRPGALLYSIELRNDAGDLLASPMLVGEEGRPVHLSFVGPHSAEPRALSLDLAPRPVDGDNLCLEYRLEIGDGFAHSGRLGLAFGEPRSVRLRGGGESLRLSFTVARARSAQFGRLLLQRRRPTT